MCHLQIQQFIISVTSPLIRLSDFYDRNFLHGTVFMEKGRRVSDGCARSELSLLNADKGTSVLTACNLIYFKTSFLQSTFSCLQYLIHIVITKLKYLHYFTTYNDIMTSQMDHQNN